MSEKENICLLWYSRVSNDDISEIINNKEYKEAIQKTMHYGLLEIRYELAPVLLLMDKFLSKILNLFVKHP